MAFEILQPDVGSRMLKTFGTLSEENRRRQELSNKVQALEQKAAQADWMNNLRMQQFGLAQQRADQSALLGLATLDLRTKTEERLAQQAAADIAEARQKLEATQGDNDARNELVGVMSLPDDSGLTLSQRLYSRDDKIANDALNAFAELDGKYAGTGKMTDAYLKGVYDRMGRNRQDQLARLREERMAKAAADAAARYDRTQDERERAAKAREGAAASKAQTTQRTEAARTRAMTLRQQVVTETQQYENLGKEILKTKDPNKKKALEQQRADLGRIVDEKKAELDRITKLPDGPRPEDMFGGNAELPPVPVDAAAPVQPSIQAVPAPIVPQAAPIPVSPTAPLQNQAPPPTQADVTGLDFIFSRPSR